MINLDYVIYRKIDKWSGLKRAVVQEPALYYLSGQSDCCIPLVEYSVIDR